MTSLTTMPTATPTLSTDLLPSAGGDATATAAAAMVGVILQTERISFLMNTNTWNMVVAPKVEQTPIINRSWVRIPPGAGLIFFLLFPLPFP